MESHCFPKKKRKLRWYIYLVPKDHEESNIDPLSFILLSPLPLANPFDISFVSDLIDIALVQIRRNLDVF
jgi:hypothetical protein